METIKPLKIKGLYVISTKVGSFKYCTLMSKKHKFAIRKYNTNPIEKITDFIKLFESCLSSVNWEVRKYTDEHREAILKMEKRISLKNYRQIVS